MTMERRDFIAATGAAVAGTRVLPATGYRLPVQTGRLKQSVCRWIYENIPLPEFARACAGLGLAAIDLLYENEWPVVRDAGLVCSMGYPPRRRSFISIGFNDPANHDMLLREL